MANPLMVKTVRIVEGVENLQKIARVLGEALLVEVKGHEIYWGRDHITIDEEALGRGH